jgi:hypothetical protein
MEQTSWVDCVRHTKRTPSGLFFLHPTLSLG